MAVGRTHASSVMPVVRSRLLASGTLTQSLTPSKLSAEPYRPAGVREGPLSVPPLPRPEAAVAVVPDASSKPQAPTRLEGAAGPTVRVTGTVAGEPPAPAAVTVTVAV